MRLVIALIALAVTGCGREESVSNFPGFGSVGHASGCGTFEDQVTDSIGTLGPHHPMTIAAWRRLEKCLEENP